MSLTFLLFTLARRLILSDEEEATLIGTFSADETPLRKTCSWQNEEAWSRTSPTQLADHLGSSHAASIFQHLLMEADHQPRSDVHSVTHAIELLADVIFYKHETEVNQTHSKAFHGNCSRSK
ncbi:hypothetical protein L3X38_025161 [Prunus dulcis]|uniref:Uncharacterized protein n=1 Tax=Prunus dulcis TaxID=3755 RepID=A0AAD4W1A6_PRUDU|nr:hypothetical protein L3X38_025161 [Prunus dulcis]